MDITCQKCGLINDYEVRQAGPHQSAYCNGCGNYIKHLPQNNPIDTLPFGKFKGRSIKSLTSADEIRYLQWLTQMPDIKGRLKQAIDTHLIAL